MKVLPQPMANMELSDEDRLDTAYPMACGPDKGPAYPYGLKICLTEKELEKLNLDHTSAQVGGMIHLHAMARITSVSQDDRADGLSVRIEAQIEDMSVESEDDEDEADEEAEPTIGRGYR